MSGDRVSLTQSALVADNQADARSQGWLADNVWHPFVNGTGVKQIYNNFASEKLQPDYVAPAKTLSTDWAVQSLASAGGAILTYTVVGKAAGLGLSTLGEKMGLEGSAARILASDTTAQIVGAGLYDFAKAPNPGETRLGNAAASVAAFGVYAAGNKMLASSKTIAESSLYTGLGRIAVGAVGGLTSIETSHEVSKLLGQDNKITWDDRLKAMASGGFVNVAMPPLQQGITKFVDYSINGQPWGKGIPIERYLQYSKEAVENKIADVPESSPGASDKITTLKQDLAMLGDPLLNKLGRDNPFARVKVAESADAVSRANIAKNRVEFNERDGAGTLAQDMKALQVAKMAEPFFNEIGKLAKTDAVQAESNYYVLRANMESASRMAKNIVEANKPGATPTVDNPLQLGTQTADNGKTYFQNWQAEFKQLQSNPKYRPSFTYAEMPAATTAGSEQASTGGYPAQKMSSKPSEAIQTKDAQALRRDSAKGGVDLLNDDLDIGMEATRRRAFSMIARETDAKAADGSSVRLGATVTDKGIDFAVTSPDATKLEVLIYDNAGDKNPSRVIPMEKTGGTWKASVDGLKEGTLYQYRAEGSNNPSVDGSRFNGKIGLVDPEAKAVSSSELPRDNHGNSSPEHLGDMPKSIAIKDSYDWKGDKAPATPMSDTVIYELNVRGYTGSDQSLNGTLRGTYRGLIEKIPHLKELGVTAVELMPIMQGDRGAWPPKNPVTGEQLRDAWNYNQVAYQAPDGSLAADGKLGQQVTEFKDLVRAMHDNKIEVILDIVFNHTREGGADGPTVNLKGLDNKDYYLLNKQNPAEYIDHTGCGNTLNTNNPVTQQLIMDTLKYWVNDMHVDGFRFDLATIFKYDVDGQQKAKTPIMERIENDPVLSKVKLIAEPWGTEQYYLGRFSDKLWGEWNGDFRDTVRKFVKSDAGQTATLADRIAGSPGWFDASKGRNSINFITVHDGMTMRDLTEYNGKHNFENGENNRDGTNDNFSWNCGVEGPLDQANLSPAEKMAIASMRSRQVKNLMAMLMLSRGTPLMLAGDEMGRTQNGNNNVWDQDKLNLMDWSLREKNAEQFNFTKGMIDLRQTHQLGRLDPNSLIWRGVEPDKPDFGDGTRFIAWQTKPSEPGVKPIYSAFNSYWEPITVTLPQGNKWFRLVDTNLPAGQDIVNPNQATFINKTYTIQPRSAIVLEGR